MQQALWTRSGEYHLLQPNIDETDAIQRALVLWVKGRREYERKYSETFNKHRVKRHATVIYAVPITSMWISRVHTPIQRWPRILTPYDAARQRPQSTQYSHDHFRAVQWWRVQISRHRLCRAIVSPFTFAITLQFKLAVWISGQNPVLTVPAVPRTFAHERFR